MFNFVSLALAQIKDSLCLFYFIDILFMFLCIFYFKILCLTVTGNFAWFDLVVSVFQIAELLIARRGQRTYIKTLKEVPKVN